MVAPAPSWWCWCGHERAPSWSRPRPRCLWRSSTPPEGGASLVASPLPTLDTVAVLILECVIYSERSDGKNKRSRRPQRIHIYIIRYSGQNILFYTRCLCILPSNYTILLQLLEAFLYLPCRLRINDILDVCNCKLMYTKYLIFRTYWSINFNKLWAWATTDNISFSCSKIKFIHLILRLSNY